MQLKRPSPSILLYGASGHTGRFIVAELLDKGFTPILAGRDRQKLEAVSAAHGGLELRTATLEDPVELARALAGAAAVINAAGPFAFTASRMVEAALRACLPCLDIAAEPDIAEEIIDRYDGPARSEGVPLAPAIGFYGGLGDLLATAAMGDWAEADEITLAYSLSSWQPTLGTRATIKAAGVRRGGKRLAFANGRLELRSDEAPTMEWDFPEPIGRQIVTSEFTTADCVTISRHLKTGAIHEVMTLAPLKDLAGPPLPTREPVDEHGRSAQIFLVEAVVRRGALQRRAVARGQDIYAVTAPMVVEATRRLLAQPGRWRGVVTAGELGDAREFLESLAPENLTLQFAP